MRQKISACTSQGAARGHHLTHLIKQQKMVLLIIVAAGFKIMNTNEQFKISASFIHNKKLYSGLILKQYIKQSKEKLNQTTN